MKKKDFFRRFSALLCSVVFVLFNPLCVASSYADDIEDVEIVEDVDDTESSETVQAISEEESDILDSLSDTEGPLLVTSLITMENPSGDFSGMDSSDKLDDIYNAIVSGNDIISRYSPSEEYEEGTEFSVNGFEFYVLKYLRECELLLVLILGVLVVQLFRRKCVK